LTEVNKNDIADSLHKRVDELMYHSKKHGKNRVSTEL
jgi:PleD family two-component response regulator